MIPIHIPALRERKSDIPALVEYLLDRFATKGKGRALAVSPRTMSVLLDYEWPGNVRELENALEHGMVCSRGGIIEPDALPRSILASPMNHPQQPYTSQTPILAADEKEHLLRVLESSRWNRGLAAARLGVDRTTRWRKMRRWGIAVLSSPVGS